MTHEGKTECKANELFYFHFSTPSYECKGLWYLWVLMGFIVSNENSFKYHNAFGEKDIT